MHFQIILQKNMYKKSKNKTSRAVVENVLICSHPESCLKGLFLLLLPDMGTTMMLI